MLYYDRIDISREIDLAESNNSKECMKVSNFSLFKVIFFYFFCFAIYKMVDSVDIYKSLNINI